MATTVATEATVPIVTSMTAVATEATVPIVTSVTAVATEATAATVEKRAMTEYLCMIIVISSTRKEKSGHD